MSVESRGFEDRGLSVAIRSDHVVEEAERMRLNYSKAIYVRRSYSIIIQLEYMSNLVRDFVVAPSTESRQG